MSWTATFWNLEYIVESARRAMEAAFNAGADPEALRTAATDPQAASAGTLPFDATSASTVSDDPMQVRDPLQDFAASIRKEELTAKQIEPPVVRSAWTPEIEAALRDFLRPFSMGVRYEYRFNDMWDERTSVETMNSLLRQPAKPAEADSRDITVRDQIRRKQLNDLRRDAQLNSIIKKD